MLNMNLAIEIQKWLIMGIFRDNFWGFPRKIKSAGEKRKMPKVVLIGWQ